MIVLEDDIQTSKRDGVTVHIRTIKKAKLIEISPVAFPAYPDNELAARSMRDLILERTTKTADEQEQETKLRLQLA